MPTTATKENQFYGSDCPEGLVQVESVHPHAEPRPHCDIRYPGYQPSESATIELYVGGRRFIIMAGGAACAYGYNQQGIVVMSDVELNAKPLAVNSALITFSETGERIWRDVQAKRKADAVTGEGESPSGDVQAAGSHEAETLNGQT
jgi:hypothetical protein